MKPRKFEYHSPASIDEALAVLARYQGDARPLAGGQSLAPMMNFRVVAPAVLVDLNRIAARSRAARSTWSVDRLGASAIRVPIRYGGKPLNH